MDEGWLQSLRQQAFKVWEDFRAAIVSVLTVAILAWVLTHLGDKATVPDWALALGIIVVLAGVGLLLWQFRRRGKVQARTVDLVRLDESLLALFPSLVRDTNREEAIKRLLHEVLRDATRLLGEHVSRAFILRENDQHELAPWVTYQMSTESEARTRFSTETGPARNRGIAGETYQDRVLRVVHMVERRRSKGWHAEVFKQENGKWGRDEETKYLTLDTSRPHPPYRSFVTVPIVATSQDCLGVLCFDSGNPKVFDPPEIRQLLVGLSVRIAAAAVIFEQLVASETETPRPEAT